MVQNGWNRTTKREIETIDRRLRRQQKRHDAFKAEFDEFKKNDLDVDILQLTLTSSKECKEEISDLKEEIKNLKAEIANGQLVSEELLNNAAQLGLTPSSQSVREWDEAEDMPMLSTPPPPPPIQRTAMLPNMSQSPFRVPRQSITPVSRKLTFEARSPPPAPSKSKSVKRKWVKYSDCKLDDGDDDESTPPTPPLKLRKYAEAKNDASTQVFAKEQCRKSGGGFVLESNPN